MYCKNCGKELQDGSLFCSMCGNSVEASTEETKKETPKVWNVFAKAGYIGGLVCLICSFIPFVGLRASGIQAQYH